MLFLFLFYSCIAATTGTTTTITSSNVSEYRKQATSYEVLSFRALEGGNSE
jgi:hypothetical protein